MLTQMFRLHKAAYKLVTGSHCRCTHTPTRSIFASTQRKPVIAECDIFDLTNTALPNPLNNATESLTVPTTLIKSIKKSSKRIKTVTQQPTYTITHYIEQTQHITIPYAYFIGFDINTNGVGYSIIDTNYTYIDSGHIDISTLDSTYNKSQYLYNELLIRLYTKYNNTPCYIIIEDYLKLYSGLKFNVKYLFDLAEINSIFTYQCQQLFHTTQYTIEKYHPNIARGTFNLKKCKLDKSIDIKHIVHKFVQPIFPCDYIWQQRKKKQALVDTQYDICDSMLLCCAKLYQLKQTQSTLLQHITNKQHL